MKTVVVYSIEGPGRNTFSKALPDHLRSYKSSAGPYDTAFLFDARALEPLGELDALARSAGFAPRIDYRFDASDEPLADDRMYVLSGELLSPPHFNFLSVAERQPCASCDYDLVRLASNDDFRPHLKLAAAPPSRVFTVEAGRAYFIEESLALELERHKVLEGAILEKAIVDGASGSYYLFASHIDLGMPHWEPSSPCSACGRELRHGGLFPLIRRPDRKVDVGYNLFFGQTIPLVSGRVARILANEPGIGFGYLGWFPDELPAAQYPPLPWMR